jgi:APA family basic amino acid/polyamine antiporter
VKGQLLRILGAGFGLAVVLGATVGGEILRLPGAVARALPSAPAFFAAWALGGGFALVSALSFAELGTRLPRSGGMTVFAQAALGPFAGFLVGWGDFLASACTISALALALGEVLAAQGLPGSPRAWGAAAVLSVGLFQLPGLRWGALLQDLTSALKGCSLLALGLGALSWSGAPARPWPSVPGGSTGLLAFMGAMQLVVFAYDNYYSAVYFGEEFTDPRRQLPRALIAGVVLVTFLYLVLAWGMVRALPFPVLVGSRLPGAELAGRMAGAAGGGLARMLMLLALLSAMNAYLLIASRVLFALGTEGHADPSAAVVNAGGTPVTGLMATLGLALAGLALPSFESAIAFMSPFVLMNYGLSFLSLLVLRRKDPQPRGIFRVPLFPLPTLLSLLGSLALLGGGLAANGWAALVPAAFLALAWPLHRRSRRTAAVRRLAED